MTTEESSEYRNVYNEATARMMRVGVLLTSKLAVIDCAGILVGTAVVLLEKAEPGIAAGWLRRLADVVETGKVPDVDDFSKPH